MRKSILAVVAAAALGGVSISAAMARDGHGMSGGMSSGMSGGMSSSFKGSGGTTTMGSSGGTFMSQGRPAGTVNGSSGNFAPQTSPNHNFTANNFSGNWQGRHDHDHDFDRDHDRFRHGFGFGGIYAFGGYPYDYDYDYGYDSCWQRRLVPTPFGLRWRVVDVCAYQY